MAYFRRTVLALALAGSGLAATTGAAFANEEHHGDDQSGIANVDDTQTVVPTEVCGNDVPVNVLGVQVPVQDVSGNVPVLSPSDDDGTNGAGVEKNCASGTDLDS